MRCVRRSLSPVRLRQPATYRSALYSSTPTAPSSRAPATSASSITTPPHMPRCSCCGVAPLNSAVGTSRGTRSWSRWSPARCARAHPCWRGSTGSSSARTTPRPARSPHCGTSCVTRDSTTGPPSSAGSSPTSARASSRTSSPTSADCPPAASPWEAPSVAARSGLARQDSLGKASAPCQARSTLPSAQSRPPVCGRQGPQNSIRSTSAERVGYLAGLGAVVDLVGYVEGQGVGVLVPVGADRLEVHLRQALVGEEVEVADEAVLVILVRDLDAEEVDDVASQ